LSADLCIYLWGFTHSLSLFLCLQNELCYHHRVEFHWCEDYAVVTYGKFFEKRNFTQNTLRADYFYCNDDNVNVLWLNDNHHMLWLPFIHLFHHRLDDEWMMWCLWDCVYWISTTVDVDNENFFLFYRKKAFLLIY
jgi:hypothetical protein